MKPTRVLGIDPGIARVGYCVFVKRPLEYTTLITKSSQEGMNNSTIDMMGQIFPKMVSLIESYKIDAIALEQAPGGVQMGQRDKVLSFQSMMRTLSLHYKIPYAEFNSRRLKNLYLENSRATKDEVREKVKEKWSIDEKSADTNDAIMVADVSSEIDLEDKVWWRWDLEQ